MIRHWPSPPRDADRYDARPIGVVDWCVWDTRQNEPVFGSDMLREDEAQGAARSFTVETVIQSSTLMITTAIGLYFALKRQFAYHRQWMIRSYAVALTFLEVRVILGVFGLDDPFDWHILETVVWSCVASSVLIGDIANQLYEGHLARLRTAAANARATVERPTRFAAAGD